MAIFFYQKEATVYAAHYKQAENPLDVSKLEWLFSGAKKLNEERVEGFFVGPRREMITLIRRSYRQGLFAATHGTYSVRLADGSFLITPFGRDRAYLEPEDLVLVRGAQREAGKIPSRAVALHGAVYEAHPEIRAVLQAHPVHAMAFAVTDAVFDPRTIPESYVLLREIQRIPFGQLYENPRVLAETFAPACPAILAENDCVVVAGDSLLQAFDRLEVLESTAESILDAVTLGNIVHISPEEVADLKVAFHLED